MKAKITLSIFSLLIFSGCSLFVPAPSVDINKTAQTYKTATRQLAPEPTYNRVRWVYLPAPLPGRDEGKFDSPQINPRFKVSLKNASLEEVARALAASSGYRAYCASTIAEQKMDLQGIGTIEEFIGIIEKKIGIKVLIDHDMRDIRFLAGNYKVPRFFEEEDSNEHQSTY